MLAKHHDVELIPDARAALRRIVEGERFDAVLCDLAMPEMSGEELYAEVTRARPELAGHIVFITGGGFSPGTKRFLETVPNQTLVKPFELHRLLRVVADVSALHPGAASPT